MSSIKLKVLMLQRVANIWKQWDIVEVSHTQAKNYLIPKLLAREITKEEIELLDKKLWDKAKNSREVLHSRHIIAEKLHTKEIIFEEKWSAWKMFWWIWEHEIIEKIRKEFWVTLEKKNIVLPDWHHLKKEWMYDLKLNLWSDVFARITINIKIV